MVGSHCVKTWSKTQAIIAKSSAESELYAVVRGACEGLGIVSLMKDFGKEAKIRLHIDSSAAKGILERQGLHKVRHLDVDMLWMQGHVAKEAFTVFKVPGEKNNSDLMTKHLGQELMRKHLNNMNIFHRSGRAESAAQLHTVEEGDKGRGGDSWGKRGHKSEWMRIHMRPRKCLFTPFRVPKGPGNGVKIGPYRRTAGKFVDTGETFIIHDEWIHGKSAHRELDRAWVGRTTFWELPHASCGTKTEHDP